MPVERRFLSVKARIGVGGERLDARAVLDIMNARHVGTRWVNLGGSVMLVRGSDGSFRSVAVVVMTIQDFDREWFDELARSVYEVEFRRWCDVIGVTIHALTVRLTDQGPATESDGVPVGIGKFGREGLSN